MRAGLGKWTGHDLVVLESCYEYRAFITILCVLGYVGSAS